MRIQALLFARLREQLGAGRMAVEVPDGATCADLFRLLEARAGTSISREGVRPARNQNFCDWDESLAEGDELAFIPPVSGGAPEPAAAHLEIVEAPLDAGRLAALVARPEAGAICSFTGVVRNHARGRQTVHLEYEAYHDMALRQMRKVAEEIAERWPQARVAMAHRVGRLEIGEASVVVVVSAPHRAEAFDACRWGIDRLKEIVPIWKKEHTPDGSSWVEETGTLPTG